MRKTVLFTAFTLVVSTQFACTADHEPTGVPSGAFRSTSIDANHEARNHTIDAQFEQLASALPGFGGLFFDGRGRLNVFLEAGTSRDAAVTVLSKFFAGRTVTVRGSELDVPGMVVHAAQFDFRDLAKWRRTLNADVFSLPGVYSTDIDETRNRIVVGVADAALSSSSLLAIAERKSIPAGAIIVEPGSPVLGIQKGGGLIEGTLADTIRPAVGGLHIGFLGVGVRGDCTLGFNASGAKFITASHCSRSHGTVGTPASTFWQPWDGPIIGYEEVDPEYVNFTAIDSRCAFDKICRYSDALYAIYELGATYDVGKIARTEFADLNQGSRVIDVTNPRWTVLSSVGWGYVGEDVNKVGAATGWTFGLVTHSCVDVPFGAATNKFLICQMRFEGAADGGDSGSPVFGRDGASSSVTLYGIIWGKDEQTGRGWFSPLMQIQEELGPLDYWAP